MCVSIADCTWLSGRLDTHDGNWLCHTRLCPRTRMLCAFANETIESPGPKLQPPLDGPEPSAANDATPAARIPVTAPAASPRYVLPGRGAAAPAVSGCTARHAFISLSSENLPKVCGSITG